MRGVSQPGIVKDVSFDLKLGEVLGVSGLMGSGRSELARILFGLDPYSEGEIRVGDAKLPPLAPREAMDKGLAFLTEDRRGEGLMMEASITDNIVLPSLVERSSGFVHWLKPAALGEAARGVAERVRVNAKAIDRTAVRTLSGGNQQKVVIAKWLLRAPIDLHSRRADAGHRRRSQIRGLQDHQPDGRRGRGDPLHLLRDRGADRHGRPHHGHGPRRGSRLLRAGATSIAKR